MKEHTVWETQQGTQCIFACACEEAGAGVVLSELTCACNGVGRFLSMISVSLLF